MNNWYWKDGTPVMTKGMKLGSKEWEKRMTELNEKLGDPTYKRIHRSRLWWGGIVSTVWLGIDHGFGLTKDDPIIFETMVFPYNSLNEMDMDRYTDEKEAKKGHWRMYWKWSNPIKILKYIRRDLYEK